jgi:hypothetical protein
MILILHHHVLRFTGPIGTSQSRIFAPFKLSHSQEISRIISSEDRERLMLINVKLTVHVVDDGAFFRVAPISPGTIGGHFVSVGSIPVAADLYYKVKTRGFLYLSTQ